MPSMQLCSELLEAALALPRGHRAAQLIGFAGVKPAATIASCITCSWKIGTPSVRSSTLSHRRRSDSRPAPRRCRAAQVRMHHVALDRPGPHDGDLDHEVVELRRAAAAAASTSARAIRSGTRRWCRRAADHLVDRAGLRPGSSPSVQRSRPRWSFAPGRSALRIAVSMPSASSRP